MPKTTMQTIAWSVTLVTPCVTRGGAVLSGRGDEVCAAPRACGAPFDSPHSLRPVACGCAAHLAYRGRAEESPEGHVEPTARHAAPAAGVEVRACGPAKAEPRRVHVEGACRGYKRAWEGAAVAMR